MELSDYSTDEIIRELLQRKDVISVTVWTKDNLRERLYTLIDNGIIDNVEVTDDLIENIRANGYWDCLGETTQNDWDILDEEILKIVGKNGTN